MGPGAADLITPAAREGVMMSDTLFGDERWLKLFADESKELFSFQPLDRMLQVIADHGNESRIAVLVSGDPGLYSLMGSIKRAAPDIAVEVIPGISAPQALFARLGREWSGVDIISLHGRSIEQLNGAVGLGSRVCILTDPEKNAGLVGRRLLELGLKGRAVVGENLSMHTEKITEVTLEGLAQLETGSLAVVYLEIEQ